MANLELFEVTIVSSIWDRISRFESVGEANGRFKFLWCSQLSMGLEWYAVSCRLSLVSLSFLATSSSVFDPSPIRSKLSPFFLSSFLPFLHCPCLSLLDPFPGLQDPSWNCCVHCARNSLGSAHCNPVLAFPMVLDTQHLSQFLWVQSVFLRATLGLPHVSLCYAFQRTQPSSPPFLCILSFNTAVLCTLLLTSF